MADICTLKRSVYWKVYVVQLCLDQACLRRCLPNERYLSCRTKISNFCHPSQHYFLCSECLTYTKLHAVVSFIIHGNAWLKPTTDKNCTCGRRVRKGPPYFRCGLVLQHHVGSLLPQITKSIFRSVSWSRRLCAVFFCKWLIFVGLFGTPE